MFCGRATTDDRAEQGNAPTLLWACDGDPTGPAQRLNCGCVASNSLVHNSLNSVAGRQFGLQTLRSTAIVRRNVAANPCSRQQSQLRWAKRPTISCQIWYASRHRLIIVYPDSIEGSSHSRLDTIVLLRRHSANGTILAVAVGISFIRIGRRYFRLRPKSGFHEHRKSGQGVLPTRSHTLMIMAISKSFLPRQIERRFSSSHDSTGP